MGLDNFPHKYPCKTQGTAVMEPRKDRDGNDIIDPETGEVAVAISCEATQACGGCPYKNAFDKSGLDGGAVYGMFGTDCWYRGKYGNWLLQDAGISDGMDDDFSFYGNADDGCYKTEASCLSLADTISDFLDDEPDWKSSESDSTAADLRYAEWYLRWAAEECGGLGAWY